MWEIRVKHLVGTFTRRETGVLMNQPDHLGDTEHSLLVEARE